MATRTEGNGRADLLAALEGLRRSGGRMRRAEAWRRRGWSATEVGAEADRVAAALAAQGVGHGDRVALWLADGPLWVAAFFGSLRAGAVAVPLDVSLGADRAREAACELAVAAVCVEREVPRLGLDRPRVTLNWSPGAAAAAPPPLPPDDPSRAAQIVLTSGTTGAPRAVSVTHANLRVVLDALEEGIAEYRRWIQLAPRLRIACALPLSHLYGQVLGVFVPPLLGADAILVPTMPAPDLARTIRHERAWVLATVPRTLSLLARWLEARGAEIWGEDGFRERLDRAQGRPWWRRAAVFARLRLELGPRLVAVVSGGAALDRDTEELWRTLGYVVVQGYGLTETAPLVTLNHPFDTEPGSLGKPLPGVEVRIAPDREILVRGANVVGGDAVDAEGWLHTGDLGRQDATDRLWYLGRKGERIVTPAGVNVDPEPVVAALVARPGIADAVVLERPWGEPGVVCAVVLARPDADPAEAVRAANEALPDAARVRAWRAWPEADFPRTSTGKPRRPEIRSWLEGQAPGHEASGGPIGRIGSRTGARDVVAGLVATVGGGERATLEPATRLGDALGSLDRVELATRIEMTYGVPLPPEAVGADRTLDELAGDLAKAGRAGAGETEDGARGAGPGHPEAEREVRVEAGTSPGPEPAPGRRTPAAREAPAPERRRVPEARWRARAPARAFRFALAQGVLRPLWRSLFDLDAAGLERLAGLDPPFLIAANHLSELDPGAVLFGLPPRLSARVATTAMWEHFERARVGRLQYGLGVAGLDLIPLLQTGDWRPTLRIAGAVADRGGCPLVYPEGERSTDGSLLPFRTGVAILARELHLPIVPCAAAGLLAVLPKGAHWARGVWRARAPVAVRFGDPLPAPRPDDDPDDIVAELRRRIERLLVAARDAAGRY